MADVGGNPNPRDGDEAGTELMLLLLLRPVFVGSVTILTLLDLGDGLLLETQDFPFRFRLDPSLPRLEVELDLFFPLKLLQLPLPLAFVLPLPVLSILFPAKEPLLFLCWLIFFFRLFISVSSTWISCWYFSPRAWAYFLSVPARFIVKASMRPLMTRSQIFASVSCAVSSANLLISRNFIFK